MGGYVMLDRLPRGCYVVHHTLIAIVGMLGLFGYLSPTLSIIPPFGVALSLGLAASGALGLYARTADDAAVEVIALRMMSGLMIGWGLAVMAAVALADSINVQGSVVLIAYGTFLWAVSQGVRRGLILDLIEIRQFVLVLLPDDTPQEPEDA